MAFRTGDGFEVNGILVIDPGGNIQSVPSIAVNQAKSSMDATNLKLEVNGSASIRGANALFFGVTTNSYNSWKTKIWNNNTSTMYVNAQEFNVNNSGYGSSTFLKAHSSGVDGTSFRDLDNTAYYANPAGTSVFNAATFASGILVTGLSQLRGGHSSSHNEQIRFGRTDDAYRYHSIYATNNSASSSLEFRLHDGGSSTAQTAVMSIRQNIHGTGDIGTLIHNATRLGFDESGTRSWSMKATGGGLNFYSGDGAGHHIFTSSGGVRAPIFYDSSNTDFRVDPVSTSHLYGTLYLGHTNSQPGTLVIYDTGNNGLEMKGTGANAFTFDMIGTGSTGTITFNDFNLVTNKNVRINAGSSDYTGQTNVDESILRMQTDYDGAGSQNLQFVKHNGNWLDGTSGADSAFGWMWSHQNNQRAGIIYDHRSTEKFDIYSSYGEIRFRTPASVNGNISPIGSESSMPARLTIGVGGAVTASNDMRAPIFYDSNDTARYLDMNGTNLSELGKIRTNASGTYTAPRWDTSFYVGQSQHWYGHTNTQTMYIGEANHIHIRNIADIAGSARAPVYYDKDDTAYYLDAASTGTSLKVAGNVLIPGYAQIAGTELSSGDTASFSNINNDDWVTVCDFSGSRKADIIEIYENESSRHNYVKLEVSWSYGQGSINVINGVRHGNHTMLKVRLLYNTADRTYGTGKLQVYMYNWSTSYTLRIKQTGFGKSNWGRATVKTSAEQGTPSGYTEHEDSVMNIIEDPNGAFGSTGRVTAGGGIDIYNGKPIKFHTDNGDGTATERGFIDAVEGGHLRIATSGGEKIVFQDGGTGGTTNLTILGSGEMVKEATERFTIKSHTNSWDGGLRFYASDNSTIFQMHPDTNGQMYVDREWRFNNSQINYGPIRRGGHNVGHLEGSYNNIGGNGSQSNPIYTIGSGYNPGTTTLSNMYGIGYTNVAASFISGSLAHGDWGMYVAADGDARIFLDGSAGHGAFAGSVKATTFYDIDNSNYYVHPGDTAISAKFRQHVSIGDGNNLTNDGGWGARLNLTDSVHSKIQISQDADSIKSEWHVHTGVDSARFGTETNHHLELRTSGNVRLKLDKNGGTTNTGNLTIASGDLQTDRYDDQGGTFLFKKGSGSGRTRHLNLADTTSDPASVSDSNNPTGISWGQRSDNNGYYMLGLKGSYNNGLSTHSRLSIGWHTGIEIGASATYGGVRFMSDSPFVSTNEIMSIGKGDSHVRVANTIYAKTFHDIDNGTYYLDPGNGGTALYTNGAWRQTSTNWTGEVAGKIQYHAGNWYLQASNTFIFRNASGVNVLETESSGRTSFHGDVRLKSGATITRLDHHNGHLEGSYNNVAANDTKSNPIYTIGSNYNPNDATLGNMYGIGYCATSASFISGNLSNGNWGMYVAADGDARIFLDGSGGHGNFAGTLRGTALYDYDNTGYWVDPNNSHSKMVGLNLHGGANNNTNDGVLYINKTSTADWAIKVHGTSSSTEYGIMNDLVGAHSYNYRALNSGAEYSRLGTDMFYHNSSIRAPIFYDSDNPNYYMDLSTNDNSVVQRGTTHIGPEGHLGLGHLSYPKTVIPGEAASWSANGTSTGQIVIDLPGTLSNYDMMYMEVDVYEYSAKNATKIIVGGHNWNSGGNSGTSNTMWHNVGVKVIGDMDKSIYFGWRNNGSVNKRVMVIGGTSSSWSYATVRVSRVHGAEFYSGSIDYTGDWNITQSTSGSYYTKNPNTDFNSTGTQTLKTHGRMAAYGYQGNGNVGGTGSASWHPSGIYSNGTNWLYGQIVMNNNIISGCRRIEVGADNSETHILRRNNANNTEIRPHASGSAGILVRNGSDQFRFQLYGDGSNYGFLDGVWASWDLRKATNGAMYLNGDTSYYVNYAGTSFFNTIKANYYQAAGSSSSFIWQDSGGTADMRLTPSTDLTVRGNVTAYGDPSDIRLKENVETIPDALEKVNKLDGITFNYKKDGSRSTGLVAQQLQEVLPEVVYETEDLDSDEKHLAVRYGNVVGLLVEAIKELKAEVDDLKEQLKNK